ncbi:DUF480 domain-containing protein [Luteimonas aestuarii]|uniref:DUF480 domain-containing protein n=1 Tax=Luteimonas aestuarii TaxID=453837 RepID=A0A4R5TPG3_9GAMM|nr:DUF480 domain-containing protein [Luteimonas aestuarii]TDK22993.1 DUF480 domain-containing protein [Luteimonas aestuarii]
MDETATTLPLTPAEARVLGCLVEKQATTPDAYPLTVNAAHAAANQKTAREPVLSLDPGAVHHALRALERKGLAKQVFSSRAERYEHRADAGLGLPRPQVALVALLLLRGAQTAHELLARSERLHAFADIDDVRHHLERLMQRVPALVAQVPRASSQREDRYAHLLCGDVPVAVPPTDRPGAAQATIAPGERQALEARVAALEAEVAELRAHIARLLDGDAE